MYIGREAFLPAPDREAAKSLFARSVERVEVETHSYCNRRCDYCPNAVGDRLGENRRMPDAVWNLLLDNLREIDYAGNFIFTSYNEPLADRAILHRIREARVGVPRARLMIYTNGDYLQSEYLEDLAAAGLDYLHVSIHVRPGDRYAEVPALNHIVKLSRRVKLPVRFEKFKANEFIAARISHRKIEIDVRAIDYFRHGTDRGGLLDGFPAHPVRTAPCHFPFSHFHIGYQGTVVPCCHVRSDAEAHAAYRYGNLLDFGSIFETYASSVAAQWRRELISMAPKRPPCDTCSVAFLSQDANVLARVQRAWETHVRNSPLERSAPHPAVDAALTISCRS